MGIIEELPELGIVKYTKPAGVIASLIPVAGPYIDAGRHRHLRNQVQGRRDLAAPGQQEDDDEVVRMMRAALEAASTRSTWCSASSAPASRWPTC